MKLLITGASGQLGRAVADCLLEKADPEDLILTTRSPERLREYAAQGVDVREADFGRPETLAAAFAGADRMLLISTDAIGQRVLQHRAAVEAAVEAGISFIVYTSFPTSGSRDPLSEEHAATELMIQTSGLEWCVLKNFPYADIEVAAMREALERGELVTNTGSAATAFVARADCAAVAAAVLAGGGHNGRTYDVTGPALIDARERARIFSEVGGEAVAVCHVDDEALALDISRRGGPPLAVALSMVGTVGALTRDGVFAVQSDTVERLTGTPPTRLQAVLQDAAR